MRVMRLYESLRSDLCLDALHQLLIDRINMAPSQGIRVDRCTEGRRNRKEIKSSERSSEGRVVRIKRILKRSVFL